MHTGSNWKLFVLATFAGAGWMGGCATNTSTEVGNATGQNSVLDNNILLNRVFGPLPGSAGVAATGGVSGTTLCQGSTLLVATDAFVCGTVESRLQSDSCPAGYEQSSVTSIFASGGMAPMFSCAREIIDSRRVIQYSSLPALTPCAQGASAIRANGVRTPINGANVLLFSYELLCSCPAENISIPSDWPDPNNQDVTTAVSEATCGPSATSGGLCPGGSAPRCNIDGTGCVC